MDLQTTGRFEPKQKQQCHLPLMRGVVHVVCVCFLMWGANAVQAQEAAKPTAKQATSESSPPKTTSDTGPVFPQKIVEQGIAIELTMDAPEKKARIRAGEDVNVKFKVTDTTTGTPVKGLGLSAWISRRADDDKEISPEKCHEKIQSYLGGTIRARPDVDLNSYYVLALNKSPDISVIDPLLGFGGSKLLTLVMMKSPGEDWVLTRDGERLFVSLPLINQVAVIDTRTWKVKEYVDTGIRPTRVALQPDQKYLWVANDGNKGEASGVTVIDAATLKVAAQIPTGTGHHEIVVSGDNRFAFISNEESGTVSIIDVRTLAKTDDLVVSRNPVSIVSSELSKAIYVTSEAEGVVTVIDAQKLQVLAQIKAKPGLRTIRFAPGGRYGFVLNSKENTVNIFDAASNRMLHEVKVGKSPDQVIFSKTFAFVRSQGTESIAMLRLATIDTDVAVTEFPGGQAAFEKASQTIQADAMVLAPEGNAVIVANPGDKVLYYYTEGMAAPMGNFQNYKREPLSVLIVDRSLRETSPGVYSAMIKLPASGKYDVAFLADSPRISHCFQTAADPNPLLKAEPTVALRIEHQIKERKLPVGENFPLRFKLFDTATGKPKSDLTDVHVLTFLSPGIWQRRDMAKSLGGGVYEIIVNVPQPGLYMVFVESASMRVAFRDLPYIMLHGVHEKTGPAATAREASTANKP
ncbi:MAG TPA: YncE family protein [Pyrinomonadaceae bacterium]